MTAIAPVYQLDLNRIQNGEYPMGAAERNLAILAAHNPNQVSSVPQDNPQPTHVMQNAVSDAGKIATGIIGLATGATEKQIWESAKSTFHDVMDPRKLEAPTLGGTIGNWLNDTLLSYLPGAADVGTVLQKDPTLTGSAGLSALADHPLMSILDVLPGARGGLVYRGAQRAGMKDLAAGLAARGGDRSALGQLAHQVGGIKAGGAGVNAQGQLVANLTVKDKILKLAARAGPGGAGVGPAISGVGEAIANTSAMRVDQWDWLMAGPTQALKDLDEADVLRVKRILSTSRTEGGDLYAESMKDPTLSPQAKDVLVQFMNGPLRFATEEELFAGHLRATRSLSGEVGIWAVAGRRAKAVLRAQRVADVARRRALDKLEELEPHAARIEVLDQMRGEALQGFRSGLVAARQQVFEDPVLQRPLTRDVASHQDVFGRTKAGGTRFRKGAPLSRLDQLHAVVDQGGIGDQFLEQVAKTSNVDQIEELATAMKRRLSSWGPKSVKASEHPALMELYRQADAFQKWARKMRSEAKAIDKAIHGTEEGRRHFLEEQIAYRRQGLEKLKARQKEERQALDQGYRRDKARRQSELAAKIRKLNEMRLMTVELIESNGDREAARLTAKVIDTEVMPRIRQRIRAVNMDTAARIKAAKKDYLTASKQKWTEYQRDSSRLVRKHYTETARTKKLITAEVEGLGDMLREAMSYGTAVRGYHDAIFNNPADQYRDVFVALIHRQIREHEESAALSIATDKFIEDKAGMTRKRLAQIRSDPDLVAELAMTHFAEIMKQPDLDPELAADAQAEMDQYRSDAHEELKLLIGQGLRVPYIPAATSFDEKLGRDSMAPLIGHGIPKPDIGKERIWDMTPRKDDFALGINKAVVQALQRDATIYLAEHYLRPMALSKEQVDDFLWVFKRPERRLAGGNLAHEMQQLTAKDLGLEAFDPQALFGFTLPRWLRSEQMYLPKDIVNALREYEKQRRRAILGTSNKVFRYSILGLSPRYTAHVVFGGTMMLALHSSPYAISMIFEAARAVRDGTLPHISRENVEMGFEQPIDLVQRQAGRDMVSLAVAEHIETVQKVARGAAKPVHALRALADINFRFVRYVRDLQAAVAYLDGAATVTRREGKVTVEDPETGKMITVSSDRAVKEGMHRVEQVFGNLRRMSPLERQIAQSVMPFYGWQKHIIGYVLKFPFDHPWRAMILSQLAFHNSQNVPLAYPVRLQLLMFLGGPDAHGNTNAVDMRSMDPFRDVANYATLTGVFESLNPALSAIPAMRFGPGFVWGSSSLYPNVTYDAFYGIRTSAPQGSWVTALEQWVPQAGAVVSAATAAGGLRSEWKTNRSAAIKQMLNSLNIPFVTPPVNLKQLAARGETARFETAKNDALTAFQTGDFRGLAGYKTVPNPLNSAYEITPAALEELYHQAQQQSPGVAPIESLLPPPTPYGF